MCLGVPGKVVELLPGSMAKVEVMGNTVDVSVRLVPDVEEDHWVLIHAGFAMEIIDEALAFETLDALEELEEYSRL